MCLKLEQMVSSWAVPSLLCSVPCEWCPLGRVCEWGIEFVRKF